MSHNWNNRSNRGAFGLCFAVLFTSAVCCLKAQEAADPAATAPPKIENPFDLLSPEPQEREAVVVKQANDAAPAGLAPADRVLTERYRKAIDHRFRRPDLRSSARLFKQSPRSSSANWRGLDHHPAKEPWRIVERVG